MQITKHLPDILRLIYDNNNPIVSVVAPTGSGKSVGIPAAVAAGGSRIFVVVPTRTAATSLAEYQTLLQKQKSKPDSVGYAAEGSVHYDDRTLIAYVTGGHARRKLLSYFSDGQARDIDFCDVLMVDEVHSGALDTTIILSLWVNAATSGAAVPRLVIASATPVPLVIDPPPKVYTVDVARFPIEYKYLDRDIDYTDMGSLADAASTRAFDICRTTPASAGHILIFAAGAKDVEAIEASVKRRFVDNKDIIVVPAFSALRREDIALIYKPTTGNQRKVIIATNIAEMSITVENVGFVIDTMIEKRSEMSNSGGSRLATHYISKDSAKQRAGRTGRTIAGTCYRLCTLQKYESLDQHRPPEVERVPIYEPVMELMSVGLDPNKVLYGVDVSRMYKTRQLLSRLGMITTGDKVTELGHFATKFPLSVRNATFLWKWVQEVNPATNQPYPIFPAVVVAALIDCAGPSYVWVPRKTIDASATNYNTTIAQYKDQYFSKFKGDNDLETAINIWRDLYGKVGSIRSDNPAVGKWARENSMNNKKIREALMIMEQSVAILQRMGKTVTIGTFNPANVMRVARPLLLSVYSDNILIVRGQGVYVNSSNFEEYRLDNRDAINKLAELNPPGIVALSSTEIKLARGHIMRIVGFSLDTSVDANGELIEKPVTRAPLNDSSLEELGQFNLDQLDQQLDPGYNEQQVVSGKNLEDMLADLEL
jgi:HrpA-like RNA helicase